MKLFVFSCFITLTALGFATYSNDKSDELDQWNQGTDLTDDPAVFLNELKCVVCHSDLPDKAIPQYAPYLDHAGLRYQPGYLFDYLQNPTAIRQNIGHARMPDFHLSKEESLALTLYLTEQRSNPDSVIDYPDFSNRPQNISDTEGSALLEALTCNTCHQINGEGTPLVSELATVGHRLQEEWVKQYLVTPQLFNRVHVVMPSLFYALQDNQLTPLSEQSQEQIEQITSYLFSFGTDHRTTLQDTYEHFRKENESITADFGKQIYGALNCAGCHDQPADQRIEIIAPRLSNAANRLQPNWITKYLSEPHAIRPSGFQPGYGSRMPDFRLTEAEVNLISSYFNEQRKSEPVFEVETLSRFSMQKAEQLIKERYACTGCHQINGSGGVLAPALDNIQHRLKADYVYQIIQNPQEVTPHSIMPQIPMPEKTVRLMSNYLLQKDSKEPKESYISFTSIRDHLETRPSSTLYHQYCAPCHGVSGQADGFNASYLKVIPTNHADKIYVSLRPDDTLYDGIHAGGYILNKSHQMPPFGQSLSRVQIKELVTYIRQLCDCEGPAWSTDNQGNE